MAYSKIPSPGMKYGPCKIECKHLDCAEAKKNAERVCPHCNQQIGYNREFTEIDSALFHLMCAWEHEEAKKVDIAKEPSTSMYLDCGHVLTSACTSPSGDVVCSECGSVLS